ncbi:MAG: 3-oxoacyl-ACP reductase [Candidatus Marinimicrobia bacterium]|nr:3-oxoacyl-ACP reductase [Candidatus Neomarinimicrobiota bacterium]
MFDLTNKVAIITGASQGIGKGMAETFSKAGAHVACVSRNKDNLKSVADSLIKNGGAASFYTCDVSSLDAFQNTIKEIVENHGSVDILVNNAGVCKDKLIMRMSEDDWNKVININLNGAFNGIKAVSQIMIKQRAGRIINISSIVGLIGNPGQANYAASKAGLIGLSKSAAKELAPRGITVNAIAPGYIATDMTDQITDQAKENLITKIPLGRIGSPSDIAASALFLASDEAGYITGQTLTVDGGMVMI